MTRRRIRHSRRSRKQSRTDQCFKAFDYFIWGCILVFTTNLFYVGLRRGGYLIDDLSNIAGEKALMEPQLPPESLQPQPLPKGPVRIAWIGNSLLYHFDTPGLLAAMLEAQGYSPVTYDACMRGGGAFATIASGTVEGRFGCSRALQMSKGPLVTVQSLLDQTWDFVILQDQSATPSVKGPRQGSLNALNESYAGPIYKSGAVPIFVQTGAYRDKIRFEYMTQQLNEGYHAYANLMTEEFSKRFSTTKKKARVAEAGEGFAKVFHGNQELWNKLYNTDGIHASAHGSWLMASVLYSTMTNTMPPPYNETLWLERHGHAKGKMADPRPTEAEAKELSAIAWSVAQNQITTAKI